MRASWLGEMTETFFPVNDLLRRRLQTGLVVISLTLCVASTLFLLLFSERIGVGIFVRSEDRLSAGFSAVFRQFQMLAVLLILVIGAGAVSFLTFMMMSQRTRDVGLMKAAGCPNEHAFGYFMTEILIVSLLSCFSGVALGTLADHASGSILDAFGFETVQTAPNIWAILLVFVVFFALTLALGAKPILDAVGVEPARAMSPLHFLGLDKEKGFKAMSRSSIAARLAFRSLSRRKSATTRILVCLSAVFTLATVSIAGGIIAGQTTQSWIEGAIGRNMVLVAHKDMVAQYKLMLSKFHSVQADTQFNYTEQRYLIPEDLPSQLVAISGVAGVEVRLATMAYAEEVQNYTYDPETQATVPVGSNRHGETLLVGIEPEKTLANWFAQGRSLTTDRPWEAVVGDSLAQKLFSKPLDQSIRLLNRTFAIGGVCLDPLNNGNVTYVSLDSLKNILGISDANILLAKTAPEASHADVVHQIQSKIADLSSDFEAFSMNEELDKATGFVGYIWSTVMLLPLFSLVTASLCLVGYVILAIAEQRQEFGILRVMGAKPKTIVKIVMVQNLVVLLASCAVGVSLGTITTLLILIPEPLVTGWTVIEIAAWLLSAIALISAFSIYPALRFARRPIPEILLQ